MKELEQKAEEIDKLIKAEINKGCEACNKQGLYHCSHPEECGVWNELLRLEKLKESNKTITNK